MEPTVRTAAHPLSPLPPSLRPRRGALGGGGGRRRGRRWVRGRARDRAGSPIRGRSLFSTVAAAVTLVMVFVLHHTQRREQVATQLKLDELIRALPQADDHYVRVQAAADDEVAGARAAAHRAPPRHPRRLIGPTRQGARRTATTAASSSLGRSTSISCMRCSHSASGWRGPGTAVGRQALQAERDRLRAALEDAVGERDECLVGAEGQGVARVLLAQPQRAGRRAPRPDHTSRGRTTQAGSARRARTRSTPSAGRACRRAR